ncbi:MAG: outer membrane lipoprotein-sorting protein [Spirochaetes bacterium]|nr:outer membrane lipoprotein-sorting protein [Spirochaetota bacterium]
MNRRLHIAAVIALAAFALSGLSAQSAEEIIKASRERISSTTVSTRSRLVITAKDGGTSERLIDQYTSKSGGTEQSVVVFQKPTSVAGTRFLTVASQGKTSDSWIFLPALGKVRRVAAGEGSGSFMGTDMSYDDVGLTNRDTGADTHLILREEGLNGKPCWVIESIPKNTDFQYSKLVLWVEKSSHATLKVELYDKRGELIKILEILKMEDKQGRLTATETKMSTLKAKTSTTIFVDIIKYDDPIPASVFTTKFLETGRP